MSNIKKLLNVGGNSKKIGITNIYKGWEHVLLDIDETLNPDIVADARDLLSLPPSTFDVIYCSHNLEHYHPHEIPRVLQGFQHLIKEKGAIDIHVPDIGEVMKLTVSQNLDMDSTLYTSNAGPISVHDILFGYHAEIEKSGNDFFAHKSGFTASYLEKVLRVNGFNFVYLGTGNLEIRAVAFTQSPNTFFKEFYQLQ
jgi:SAM-dependent methyltransferase